MWNQKRPAIRASSALPAFWNRLPVWTGSYGLITLVAHRYHHFLFMALLKALICNWEAENYSVWRAKWLTGQSLDPWSQEHPLLLFTKHKNKSNNQARTFWLRVLCTTCSYAWSDSRGHQSAEVKSSPTSTRNLKSHSWIQCALRLIFTRNAPKIKDNEDMNCGFSSYSRFYCEQLSVLWY